MRRWTSVYHYEWSPIITFAARKLRLLEWVEGHLKPFAFQDNERYVAVEVGRRGVRVVAHASGMDLLDGSAESGGVAVLGEAIDGVLEVFDPGEVRLVAASVAWSEGLTSSNYLAARQSFTRSLMPTADWGSELRPDDSSVLINFTSPTYAAQMEWGIVSETELFKRLLDPAVGRLKSGRPVARIGDASTLPAASLFVDTLVLPSREQAFQGLDGVTASMSEADWIASQAVNALYTSINERIGDAQ